MASSIVARARAIAFFGIALAACGSSKTNDGAATGSDGGAAGAASDACVPFTQRCDGRSIKLCNPDGASETVQLTCAEGLRCVEAGGTAGCDTRACTPGEALCDGNLATTCAADGSGPKPGGTSCSPRQCELGKCVAIECTAGALLCSGGDVHRCGRDGKSITLVEDCEPGELCDADTGKCSERVCQPDLASCNGTIANTCNRFGTGFLDPLDCADDELECYDGKCIDRVCEPAQRFCRDDNVVQCSLSGEDSTLSQTCNHPLEHCEESSGGFAFCFADVCTPGELSCDKNVVKRCTEQGSFPSEIEEDCGDGWCVDGACAARTCESGSYFCQDSDIYYCEYQAPPQLYVECEGDTVCRSAGATSDPNYPYGVFCGERSCTAGETACLQNQIGKCGADGESLSEVTTSCATDGKVCTVDHACAATATDSLGVGETGVFLAADSFTGNLIEVTSARTLTQLRGYLGLPSARQLRWVIYEQTGNAFVAKVDKVASVASSTGFVASPAFSFPLQVGKRYLLGVAISGGDVSSYYDGAPYEAHMSFGSVLGQFSSFYAARYDYLDNFSHESLLQLEVTTQP
jgi:hypothetical protein